MIETKSDNKNSFSFIKECWNNVKARFLDFFSKPVGRKTYYSSLTPMDNLKSDEYFNALDWALREGKTNKIRNIAVSGIYGSGKSSVLKSYQKHNIKPKYISISLANFVDSKEDNEIPKAVELSILQQLFYKVNQTSIRQSRFRKIPQMGIDFHCMINTVITVIIIAAIIVRFFPSAIYSLMFSPVYIQGHNWVLYLAQAVVAFAAFFLVYSCFNLIKNRINISHIRIGNLEMGVVDKGEDDSSLLNEYIDEIIYFFAATKFNVVIIEDLDRFNNPDVFSKLREINHQINDSDVVKSPIYFIYALRDDVFKNKDHRTKFFDFIIPIVPVVSSSNSGEEMLKLVQKTHFKEDVSSQLIYGVSVYIQDMRVIKNIVNEFIVYTSKLDVISYEQKKSDSKIHNGITSLFAIVVYKNLFPEDFDALQRNSGFLFSIFDKKDSYIAKSKIAKNAKLQALLRRMKILDNEYLFSPREFKLVIWDHIHQAHPNMLSIKFNDCNTSTVFDRNSFLSNFNFNDMEGFTSITVKLDPRQPTQTIVADDINEELGFGVTIYERFRSTEKISSTINEELTNKIRILRNEIKETDNLSLEELFKDYDKIDELIGVALPNSLRFLLENGYISESYNSYITRFIPGKLSRNDFQFQLSVQNREMLDFDHNLSSVDNVIDRLQEKYFYSPNILNFDIVDHLIQNTIWNHSQKKKLLFDYLCAPDSKESHNFVELYLERNINVEGVFESMSKSHHFVSFVQDYKKLKKNEAFKAFLKNTVLYASLDDLDTQNNTQGKEGILTQFLSDPDGTVQLFDSTDDLAKVCEVLRKLDVEFSSIVKDKIHSDIFNCICKFWLYEINPNNIEIVVLDKGDMDEVRASDYKPYSYTTVLESNYQPLIEYVNKWINTYVSSVYVNNSNEITETTESVTKLLSLEKLSDESRKGIIVHVDFTATDINEFEKQDWTIIIENEKMLISWENINQYFLEFTIDEALITLLNSDSTGPLENSDVKNLQENVIDDTYLELLISIIKNESIDFDNYSILICNWNTQLSSVQELETNPSRLEVLIENDMIVFDQENFNYIKIEFNPLLSKFVESNFDEFNQNFDSYELDSNATSELLESDALSAENLRDLVDNLLPEEIHENCEQVLDILKMSPENISSDVLIATFEGFSADGESDYFAEVQAQLLISNYENLAREEIIEILKVMSGDYPKTVKAYHKPKFNRTDVNTILVKKLKKDEIISSYKNSSSPFGRKLITVYAFHDDLD